MSKMDRALKILGLDRGASASDVQDAFDDLSTVWHPDRFLNKPGLRSKAETRLSELKSAYKFLGDHYRLSQSEVDTLDETVVVRGLRTIKTSLARAIILVGIVSVMSVMSLIFLSWSGDEPDGKESQVRTIPKRANLDASRLKLTNDQLGERVPVHMAIPKRTNTPNFQSPAERERGSGDNWPNTRQLDEPPELEMPTLMFEPETNTLDNLPLDYFTVGSTTDEVVAVQGSPTSVSTVGKFTTYYYGSAAVDFKNGKVTEYSNWGRKLKVRKIPKRSIPR